MDKLTLNESYCQQELEKVHSWHMQFALFWVIELENWPVRLGRNIEMKIWKSNKYEIAVSRSNVEAPQLSTIGWDLQPADVRIESVAAETANQGSEATKLRVLASLDWSGLWIYWTWSWPLYTAATVVSEATVSSCSQTTSTIRLFIYFYAVINQRKYKKII